ncbi:A/G-specific adenine DNA glycosylase [Galdieria sulphuraria]|nr:A/G-specific adenine DNA glycosylase [Galdieria sulphuraria]
MGFVPAIVVGSDTPRKQKSETSGISKKRAINRIKQGPRQKVGDVEDLLTYLYQKDKRNKWVTDEKEISRFQHTLLEWYKKNRRQLPWRQTLMEGYYKKWLQTFPDIPSLAASSLERVNEIWAGLGYYRRAKLLHEGAQTIMSRFDGKVPEDIKVLQSIPGIGPYTSAAIASIAFNKPYAVCDGNVFRVLSRLFSIDLDISSTDNQSLFRSLAQFLMFKEMAADYNQAMMELGATVCTPKSFDCNHCPVQRWCNSFQIANEHQVPLSDIVCQFPVKSSRVKQNEDELLVYLIKFANHFLMLKNISRNLLGNLWHFPYVIWKRNGNTMTEEEKIQHECCLVGVLHSCGYPLNDTNGLPKLLHESAIPIGLFACPRKPN